MKDYAFLSYKHKKDAATSDFLLRGTSIHPENTCVAFKRHNGLHGSVPLSIVSLICNGSTSLGFPVCILF